MFLDNRNGDDLDSAASAVVQPSIHLYEVGGNIGMYPISLTAAIH